MKHQAINLVKFKALCKRLKCPMCHAVGYLETLWIFAQIQARDGVLTSFSNLEIAAWIEYPGDSDEFVKALIECRWLDRLEDGSLRIHDWDEHKPNWLKGVAARELGADPSREPGNELGADPSLKPSTKPPKPKPKPNLTQPEPNPVQPFFAAARAADCRSLDFSPLEGTGKVGRASAKLSSVLSKRSIGGCNPEWIWRHCAVAELLRPGLIDDVCAKVLERDIRKPKSYIEKALRDECDAIGIPLAAAIASVPQLPKTCEMEAVGT